ncbi:mobile mystery protein B [Euzebya pacifica]|jgi:Fic-DOC domain mobile mystery protein B|uniref:mobile mystery protein B n=1 Tax=Euzebya pacifica TaxID=1608957 RepID=UPI0030FBAE52
MSWTFDGDGQTPLGPDDRTGLIPTWIATRGDLDEVEQDNIVRARADWLRRDVPLDGLLDDLAVRALHRDMARRVWRWAGRYRQTDVNLGIDPRDIPQRVRDLVDDASLWLQGDDRRVELARIHHRIVSIHAFPNVNGRHGRLWVDLIARAVGAPMPSWNVPAADYLGALRHADRTDELHLLVECMWNPEPGTFSSVRGRRWSMTSTHGPAESAGIQVTRAGCSSPVWPGGVPMPAPCRARRNGSTSSASRRRKGRESAAHTRAAGSPNPSEVPACTVDALGSRARVLGWSSRNEISR